MRKPSVGCSEIDRFISIPPRQFAHRVVELIGDVILIRPHAYFQKSVPRANNRALSNGRHHSRYRATRQSRALNRLQGPQRLPQRFDRDAGSGSRVGARARLLPDGRGKRFATTQDPSDGFSFGFPNNAIGEFASRLIVGVVTIVEKAGYNILLYPLTGDPIERLNSICRTGEVDGLLLMGSERLAESVVLLRKE